jgi:hypothetical protein
MIRRFFIVFVAGLGIVGSSKLAIAYVNASPTLSRLNARAQHWINTHAIAISGVHHRLGHR